MQRASPRVIVASIVGLLVVALLVFAVSARHSGGLQGRQIGLDFSRRMLQGVTPAPAPAVVGTKPIYCPVAGCGSPP